MKVRRILTTSALIFLLLVAAGAGGSWYWWQSQQGKLPDGLASGNGRIEANQVDISAKSAGHLLVMPLTAFEIALAKVWANGVVIIVAFVCSLLSVVGGDVSRSQPVSFQALDRDDTVSWLPAARARWPSNRNVAAGV